MGESKRLLSVFAGVICSFLHPVLLPAQTEIAPVALFTFNKASAKNDAGGEPAKAVGVAYGEDRFGNSRSACFLSGTQSSYLNLGTGDELKPPQGTVSIWVKLISEVYSGDGYWANPIVLTKNGPGDDFFEAYSIAYDLRNKRVGAASAQSYLNQVCARSTGTFSLNKWHHIVMTYSDTAVVLYLDGILQHSVAKNFRTQFLAGDSVLIGSSGNIKNQRFLSAYVDDIAIYDKVLSAEAVATLYEEGDPNRYRNLILIVAGALTIVGLLIFILVRRFRRVLREEREKNRMQRQVFEMETRVIKAQMNPHFIFNSMNSIQQFILANDTENANEYLVKFAKLLRGILESSTDEYISLENEVDILHKYIEIESLRFESAFSYQVRLDGKLKEKETRIPHMLIQPFVENAIWHGLLKKEGNKNLHIGFEYINEHSLLCVVDDNGAGRRPHQASGPVRKRKSLGIQFTAQRLELMRKEWGGNYGVEITDKVNSEGGSEGTRVTITIPILKN